MHRTFARIYAIAARSEWFLACAGTGAGVRDCTYKMLYGWVRGARIVKTMSYSESRANYAATLDSVVDDREEVVVTRAGHEPVVMVALSEYEALRETAYLLRSPENARRLVSAIEELEAGRGIERGLDE
ncbi:hypothetical protein GCM10023405_40320 [Streptomonospora salina]